MNKLFLTDTHCHIHDNDYKLSTLDVLSAAIDNNVTRILTLGSNVASSKKAVHYCHQFNDLNRINIRCGVGVYPHEITNFIDQDIAELKQLIENYPNQVIAIGEVGLDYCYDGVKPSNQIAALEKMIQLGIDYDLGISFHVRSGKFGNPFNDFVALIDNFGGRVKGVLHSFTDTEESLDKILSRNLYIGVNGISTFNKDPNLDKVFNIIPLDRMVLETDSPYLAPKPYRGKTCQPAYIKNIAEAMAHRRNMTINEITTVTTANSQKVYQF